MSTGLEASTSSARPLDRRYESARSTRSQVIEQGLPAVARVPVAILQFVAFALTARAAGEVAFGLLVFTQTAVRLTTAAALRGAAPLILAAFASKAPEVARRDLRSELRTSVRWTLPLWAILLVVEVFTFDLDMAQSVQVALVLFAIVNAGVVLRLLAEAAKGAGAPIQSILGEFGPLPVVIFMLLGLGTFDAGAGSTPLLRVLAALLIAQVLGCALLALQLRRRLTQSHSSDVSSRTTSKPSRAHLSVSTTATLALPLAALGVTALLGTSEAVGRLGAVLRILSPAAILISGIAAGVLPRIARANASRSSHSSQRRTLAVSWALVAATSIPYSIILLVAPSLIELIYGPDFAQLTTAMRIVALGQLVNGFTGVAVEVLQVTGRERDDTTALAWTVPFATVALAIAVLNGAPAEISGAIFFATVLAMRSLIAGARVYAPIVRQTPVLTARIKGD